MDIFFTNEQRWSSGVCIAGHRRIVYIVRAGGDLLVKLRLLMLCVLAKPWDYRYLWTSWWASAVPGDLRKQYDLMFVRNLFQAELSSALTIAFT